MLMVMPAAVGVVVVFLCGMLMVMPSAVGVVVVFLCGMLMVMPAAVGVVMLFLCGMLMVMPAAVGVVVVFLCGMLMVMPSAVGVVVVFLCGMLMVMPAAVGVVMKRLHLLGYILKCHFVLFFTVQLHAGMVSSFRLRMVIAATVFTGMLRVLMLLLSRQVGNKPQRCQGNKQLRCFHCFSVKWGFRY